MRTWELTLRENLNDTDRKKKYKPKCGKWPYHLVRAKFAITFICWWRHQPNEAKNKNEQDYRASQNATTDSICCTSNVQWWSKDKGPMGVVRWWRKWCRLSNWPPNLLKNEENRQKLRYFCYRSNVRINGEIRTLIFQEPSLTGKSQTQDVIQPDYEPKNLEQTSMPEAAEGLPKQNKFKFSMRNRINKHFLVKEITHYHLIKKTRPS